MHSRTLAMHLGHECVELPCLSQMNTSPPNVVLPFLNSHTTPYIRLHMASLLVQLYLSLASSSNAGPLGLHWLAQLHWAPLTLLAYPAPLAHSYSTGLQWPNQNSLIFSHSAGFLSIRWLFGQYRPSLAPFGNTCLH